MTDIVITKDNGDGTESSHFFHLRGRPNYRLHTNDSPYLMNFGGELQLQFDYCSSIHRYFDEWLSNVLSTNRSNISSGVRRLIKILSEDNTLLEEIHFNDCIIHSIATQNYGRTGNCIDTITVTIFFEYYTQSNYDTDVNNCLVHISGNDIIHGTISFVDNTQHHIFVPRINSNMATKEWVNSNDENTVSDSFKILLNNLINELE